jgi:hypothetical protein
VRRQRVEFYPTQQTSYTQDNERLRFVLAAPSDFIDMPEVYFTWDLKITVTNGDAKVDEDVFLSRTGVEAMIKTLRVKDRLTGRDIIDDQYHNRRCSLFKMYRLSESDQYTMGFGSKMDTSIFSSTQQLSIHRGALATFNTDPITIPNNYLGTAAANGTTTFLNRLVFKIDHAFFDHVYPLFLMPNGLEIELELERASRAFVVGSRGAADATKTISAFTYEVNNPRCYAELLQPSPSVRARWEEVYNSPKGVQFMIPQYRVQRLQPTDGLNLEEAANFPVRSARKVFAVMMDQATCEDDNLSLVIYNDSVAQFCRSGIVKYQFRVGANEYPEQPLDLDSTISSSTNAENGILARYQALEMYHQALTVFETNHVNFIPATEWADNQYDMITNNATPTIIKDSRCFVMCADLARDNSFLSGTDLTQVPLQISATRSSELASHNAKWGSNKFILYMFVLYDSLFVLQRANHQLLS